MRCATTTLVWVFKNPCSRIEMWGLAGAHLLRVGPEPAVARWCDTKKTSYVVVETDRFRLFGGNRIFELGRSHFRR
jgi:hypothetical protein